MSKLILTRGNVGSGKSTKALAWVAEDTQKRARVNRDETRFCLYGSYWFGGDYNMEEAVTTAQHAAVEALLRAGKDVVVDDTNLRQKHARAWADLAVKTSSDFEVWDMTDIPLEECIRRDAARGASGGRLVGEQVIRDMHARYLSSGPLMPVTPTTQIQVEIKQYVPNPDLPSAVIVDIDGTVALHVSRSPYDTSLYHTDEPNTQVVRLVQDLARGGENIVFCSGRNEDFRKETQDWLNTHVAVEGPLFMRKSGDFRNDAIIKPELFWENIAPYYNVKVWIDDRQRVVDMIRSLGITVLQCAPGDF